MRDRNAQPRKLFSQLDRESRTIVSRLRRPDVSEATLSPYLPKQSA